MNKHFTFHSFNLKFQSFHKRLLLVVIFITLLRMNFVCNSSEMSFDSFNSLYMNIMYNRRKSCWPQKFMHWTRLSSKLMNTQHDFSDFVNILSDYSNESFSTPLTKLRQTYLVYLPLWFIPFLFDFRYLLQIKVYGLFRSENQREIS